MRGQSVEAVSLPDTKRNVENGTINRIVDSKRKSEGFVVFHFLTKLFDVPS